MTEEKTRQIKYKRIIKRVGSSYNYPIKTAKFIRSVKKYYKEHSFMTDKQYSAMFRIAYPQTSGAWMRYAGNEFNQL